MFEFFIILNTVQAKLRWPKMLSNFCKEKKSGVCRKFRFPDFATKIQSKGNFPLKGVFDKNLAIN